jgi:sarcosine oxidase subunit beta
MISGGHQGRWNAETGRGEPIAAEVTANVATAVAVYPSLEGLEVEVADTSHLEAVSLDGVPIIDTLPGNDQVLYATGWCGHGWAIAPAVSEMIADWALTGTRPAMLAPFAASRFG